ncbi:MAG: NUDIX domain-containing protein [Calditrichaeota bacterium]|nr:MAG: NUDIX domain-containing protein [Calditrichota bacterium]
MLDRKTLLKNLSIGFIPLFVFILADELFGLTIGLLVAIAVGLLETGYIYWQEKRIDRFILFDTGLIVTLGGVSLLLHNDIFFKLKPALIEAILVILMGLTAFTNKTILIQMTGRYMKGIELSDVHIQQMRQMMRRMFYVILVHTLLIVYSAFYMSTEAWGFISGGLFYIVLGIMMGVEFVRAKLNQRKMARLLEGQEWFDIVTPEGKIIGKAPRMAVHGNPELLHPVVHVHIINSRGELYLQKRAESKDLYPGYWDTAVGGHVQSGESIEHALHREAEEELGISMAKFQPLFRYVMRNEYESELVHGFLLKDDGPFFINKQEISEGKFWKLEEIESQLGKKVFTPNFEQEYEILKRYVFKVSSPPMK